MTTFEALVSISQMVLRARGQWHAGATAYDDIERAVSECAAVVRGDDHLDRWPATVVTLDQIHMAIAELKIRAGYAGAYDDGAAGPASRPQARKEVA